MQPVIYFLLREENPEQIGCWVARRAWLCSHTHCCQIEETKRQRPLRGGGRCSLRTKARVWRRCLQPAEYCIAKPEDGTEYLNKALVYFLALIFAFLMIAVHLALA